MWTHPSPLHILDLMRSQGTDKIGFDLETDNQRTVESERHPMSDSNRRIHSPPKDKQSYPVKAIWEMATEQR